MCLCSCLYICLSIHMSMHVSMFTNLTLPPSVCIFSVVCSQAFSFESVQNSYLLTKPVFIDLTLYVIVRY